MGSVTAATYFTGQTVRYIGPVPPLDPPAWMRDLASFRHLDFGGQTVEIMTTSGTQHVQAEHIEAAEDPTPPATVHSGRCYCPRFGPGHIPGLISGPWIKCKGDVHRPHDPASCPACLAGATDAAR